MNNPLKSFSSLSLGLLLARIPMGAFFIIAGYKKLMVIGMQKFIEENIQHVPATVPHDLGSYYLHALPYLEMAVGTLLIVGFVTRFMGLLGAAMVVSFVIGSTGLMNSATGFHSNVIFIGLLSLLFFSGAGALSLDGLLFNNARQQRRANAAT